MKGKEVPSGEQWKEGCLVFTCNNGKVEEKLAEKCAKLIEEEVAKIVEKKLEKCKFIQVIETGFVITKFMSR